MNVEKVIWSLEELSDRELQKELWTGEIGGQMSSFVEAMCGTFDDSGLGLLLESTNPSTELSAEAIEAAFRLDHLIRQVPQALAPIDVIEHPAMSEVRSAAQKLLTLLDGRHFED